MSKGGLALSSLVMAIPAGVLTYVSIRSVFDHNESMPLPVTIIVWTLVILGGLLSLSPVIFMIAGPSGAMTVPVSAAVAEAPAVESKKSSKKKANDDEDEFDHETGDDGDEQLFDASDEEAGADEFEDNFNFDEDEEVEEFEEEQPAPKKKKKK